MLHGNAAAIRQYSKEIKEATLRGWKSKYLAKIHLHRGNDDFVIKTLPSKKTVKCYIKAVREEGGVVTSTIVIAAATAFIKKNMT